MGSILKFSERDIQDHIWDRRNEWEDIVIDFPEVELFNLSVSEVDVSPGKIFYNQIIRKMERLYSKAACADIFANEVPLIKDGGNPMRVDMMSTFLDDTSIGIIELKKSKQTERQAFTELLAYSNYFTSLFPGSTKEDVFLILVAPMETKIVKEALIQSLLFDGRSIVAYSPIFEDDNDIKTLRLKPWVPIFEDISIYAQTSFSGKNLSVCKVVWEYSEGVWDAKKGENPENYMIQNMNHVSALAAQLMEKRGIHGFTYCSQLWPELSEALPLTNSLVIVGVNPYAVSSSNSLLNKGVKRSELPHSLEHIESLESIITGLSKSRGYDEDEWGRMYSLYAVWDSNLYRVAKEVVDMSTMLVDGQRPMIDSGFMRWDEYQIQFLEDVSCHNYSVRPSGIFRELYWDVTKYDYMFAGKEGAENHPILGDLCHQSITTLTSQSFFRRFIERMFYSDNNT